MQKYTAEYPGRISGSQQKTIVIAQAIVTEPRLLLMDEPLSNIDIKRCEKIRHIQHETQITTVYVTHDQEDAFLLANKVAVITAGMVEQVGSPEEMYSSPKLFFVAGFVGESNVIPVKIVGKVRYSPHGVSSHAAQKAMREEMPSSSSDHIMQKMEDLFF